MISFKEALAMVETAVHPLSAENVQLMQAFNRVMAEDVLSDTDMPPFDKAAMDGFACRKADLGNEMQIVEEIPAGKIPAFPIGPHQCARIMTGAMVPQGADFVLMKEHAEVLVTGEVRCSHQGARENICYRGEDVRKGDVVLKTGNKLNPARIAMLAASGITRPRVYKLPGVAVISTGNELVEPGHVPGPGKIRNSNGFQLAAHVMQCDLVPDYLGIVPDVPSLLYEILSGAVKKYDLVLISGGVSVGDYDFIPLILSQLKADILFHGMKVKPGKHLLLASKGGCVVVGMPGNPVSSFIQFEVLVKPLLNRLSGLTDIAGPLFMPVAETYYRKKPDTLNFIPVSFTQEGSVLPMEYHGSAHIHAYSGAHGIMEVPPGITEIAKGELVYVRPL